jgi:hypothetical protein
MEAEGTTFGTITIDGKIYEHDVIIRLSSKVVNSEEEAVEEALRHLARALEKRSKFVFEEGCEQPILGSGQMGNVHLSPEAEAYFAKKGYKLLLHPPSRNSICSTSRM